MSTPFIDVGMGDDLTDGSLGGILRITTTVLANPQAVVESLMRTEPGLGEHFVRRSTRTKTPLPSS